MFANSRKHLTYANVMSTLCLFIVLGGSSYAAVTLTRNSVRSRHIKDGQVKRSDLGKNAVDSTKVADAGLLARDFAAGQLPQGPPGQPGQPGQQGERGPGAVKLDLNRTAAIVGPSSLGTIGPWEISAACRLGSGATAAELFLFLTGPGEFQMSGNAVVDDGATTTHTNAGGGLSTSSATEIHDVPSSPGHFIRIADTVQLKSATAAATVTYNFLSDTRTTPRCSGAGTAVLAG